MSLKDLLFGHKNHPTMFPYGKRPPESHTNTDMTGGFKADSKSLNAIWHGDNNAYNLAQGMIYTPIARPCQLIGIPMPVADNPTTQEIADEIQKSKMGEFPDMEHTKQVYGTQWRFPRWDSKKAKLDWEYINDDTVERIEQDVLSGDIVGVWTHDYFTVSKGRTNTESLERIRHFTLKEINVQWVTKGTNNTIKDYTQRNVFGILPIPNAHNTSSNKWRGYSVIGPSMRLIKTSHDVLRNACQILSEFEPKWVQTVGSVDTWLNNNGFESKNGVLQASKAAYSSHFQINLTDEKTEYMFMPSGAMDQYETMLKRLRTEVIASGPVPEIFYGNLATGNEASVTSHKQAMINYVQSLRQENIAFYNALYNSSLRIRSFIDNHDYGEVKTEYGHLDMLSAAERATILQNTAAGIGSIVSSASATIDDIYFIWKGLYPDLPEKDIEKFTEGIAATAMHKAVSNTDAATLADINNV